MKEKEIIATTWKLYNYNDLASIGAHHLQDNDFIKTGYRVHLTFKQCMRSLFKFHNELFNVWTHLVGSLLFIGFAAYVLFSDGWEHDHTPSAAELKEERFHRTIFFTYCVCALFCMGASAVFHLFGCMSKPIFLVLLKGDYAGVSALIGGSLLIFVYESWLCVPYWRFIYMCACSALIFAGFTLSFTSKFYSVAWRPIRAGIFVAMGATGAIPCTHFVYRVLHHTGDFFHQEIDLLWPMAMMALTYLIGVGFFVGRIPERFSPGRFDYSFYSHTYMHLFVVVASLFHLYGAIRMFNYRTAHNGCALWNEWFKD